MRSRHGSPPASRIGFQSQVEVLRNSGRKGHSTKRAAPSITFYGHTLDLRGGPEALFAGFDSSVRRAIRKAQRSHLEFQVSHSEEAVRSFYDLHAQTRRRHGLPPQPISFFLNIYELIVRSGSGFVALALHRERPVAGALFLHKGTKAIYKFGASDDKFQHLRPTNLVFWESINLLARQGFESLNLGRTSARKRRSASLQIVMGQHRRDDQVFPI